MTDNLHPGRIDLRVLDESAGAPNPDTLIPAVIAASARFRNADVRDDFQQFRDYVRPALLAAGTLVAMAVGTVRSIPSENPSETPIKAVADWTGSHHLPSNGDLLLAFQGYGR
ncbi:MAG TPA: hypothetical protein VGO33_14865 [Gemmatimonadaceae bacterium]|jgi:hypothetical protein|nr:hypothetical protein [Gemmatimonadaceae bacterium]